MAASLMFRPAWQATHHCKSATRIDPPKHQEPITCVTNRRRYGVRFECRFTGRKRNLTLAMIKKLHKGLKIPYGCLIH
jgi:hypothetical protein